MRLLLALTLTLLATTPGSMSHAAASRFLRVGAKQSVTASADHLVPHRRARRAIEKLALAALRKEGKIPAVFGLSGLPTIRDLHWTATSMQLGHEPGTVDVFVSSRFQLQHDRVVVGADELRVTIDVRDLASRKDASPGFRGGRSRKYTITEGLHRERRGQSVAQTTGELSASDLADDAGRRDHR